MIIIRLFATIFALAGASASAQIVYSDALSGSSGSPLNGTAPSVRPSSETWAGSTTSTVSSTDITHQWNADGSYSQVNQFTGQSTWTANAFLPVSISNGNIYDLQATLSLSGTTNGWLALGFSSGNTISQGSGLSGTVNGFQGTSVNAAPWLLMRSSINAITPNQVATRLGPSTTTVLNTSTTSSGANTFRIRLDTTSTLWQVSFFDGVTQLGTTTSYAANPSISYIGFGLSNNNPAGATADVSNFSLTVVPEPSSFLLIAGGLGALTLLRRRRQA